jgi:hypothetical protein
MALVRAMSMLHLSTAVVLALLLLSCASPQAPRAPPIVETHAAMLVVPPPDTPARAPEPDLHARVERDAGDVFRSMHGDLLRCFARAPPGAHAFVTIDVLVGSDGEVRDVATTGGALVGGATTCIARRVAKASFPPPRGGGTARIRVPLEFER